MSKNTIYLIDGTSLCYRAFFAIKLSNSRGFPTGAVFGFYQTLRKIISKYNPLYMGVCFDVSRKTFRQEKFNDYKINRPPLPDALKAQFPIVKELISYLGITMIEKEGFEADDIIAELCNKARKDNLSVVIVSSDKDLFQLIDSDKVAIYNQNKDKLITEKEFLKEYGFAPQLIIDYLSLTGDSTDNIPGAKGIGKVGAAKLIGEFGELTNIFKNLNKLPKKLQELLKENKKMILLSKDLVELSACDLKIGWQDLKVEEPNQQELYRIFSELEFKGFLKEISSAAINLGIEVKKEIPKSLLRRLANEPLVFFSKEEDVFVLDEVNNCVYKTDLQTAEEVIGDPKVKKISYGFKDQLTYLENIDIKGLWFDVEIGAYLDDSSLSDFSLPNLVSHYLGEYFSQIPAKFAPYFIYRLYVLLAVKLKEQALEKLFYDVEMPLIYVLYAMQRDGLKVNIGDLEDLSKKSS